MSELSPRARAVLASVRSADRPRAADRARVGAQLAARLAAMSVAAVPAPGAPPVASSAISGLAAKALVLSAIVGASSFAAGYFVGRSDSAPSRPALTATNSAAAPPMAEVAPTHDVETMSPVPEATAPAPEQHPAAHASSTGVTAPSAPSAAAAPSSDPRPQASSLAEETALLAAARAALGRGEAKDALAKLEEMSERHPAGVLREERMATRVMALCAAGRTDDARAEAQRFLQETPRSLQAARVRASCVFAKP